MQLARVFGQDKLFFAADFIGSGVDKRAVQLLFPFLLFQIATGVGFGNLFQNVFQIISNFDGFGIAAQFFHAVLDVYAQNFDSFELGGNAGNKLLKGLRFGILEAEFFGFGVPCDAHAA